MRVDYSAGHELVTVRECARNVGQRGEYVQTRGVRFRLDVLPTPPPRVRLAWPLRALAWVLRRVAVCVAVIAVWQRAILRWRAPWKLVGGCASCGKCCENLLLEAEKTPHWLRRFWHEQVFDFYQKENGIEGFVAYGCRNFTAERTCARYALRPFVCRAYPALALYERPRPKAHCGFKVIDD